MSWALAQLGECTRIVSGATPSTTVTAHWDGDVKWATPKDLSNLNSIFIDNTSRKITQSGLTSCAAEVLPAGSVLFSSRAPIGHVAINTAPMATNQGFKSFVPNPDRLIAGYLYWWLKANRSYLESLGNGATFKEVSKSVVSRIEIPLPPLGEQRRIAAILDQANVLHRKRREGLIKITMLPQSIFFEMFGDPTTNPFGWRISTLGQASTNFSDGPFGSNLKSEHYVENGVRVIRLQNIGVGELIDDDKSYISEEHFARLAKHACIPGDVLIGTLGDPNLRACIQPKAISIALNKADCVQMRCDPEQCTAEYVSVLLNIPSIEQMAQSKIHGQTRLRISMGRLRQLQVPIPPIAYQRKFSETVKDIDSEKLQHASYRDQLGALFASLQYRAFRGEL